MVGTPGRSGGNREQGIDAFPNDGPPDIPEGKSKRFVKKWNRLMKLLPASSLRKVDEYILKELTNLFLRSDDIDDALEETPGDLALIKTGIMVSREIKGLSALFGLSPADRQRLKLEPDDSEKDELSAWRNS